MENTTQALEARIAALEKHLGISKEPKDGEWYEFNPMGIKWIYKFKDMKDADTANYHLAISEYGNLEIDNTANPIKHARKITPEEALPYFEKWAEKEGFKLGSKYKSAETGAEHTFTGVERSGFPFDFISGGNNVGRIFDNRTNTFATLIKKKIKPLEVGDVLVVADAEVLEITLKNTELKETVCLYHSEIEQIYKLSLKAQGK